jgi:hypothetical protein
MRISHKAGSDVLILTSKVFYSLKEHPDLKSFAKRYAPISPALLVAAIVVLYQLTPLLIIVQHSLYM